MKSINLDQESSELGDRIDNQIDALEKGMEAIKELRETKETDYYKEATLEQGEIFDKMFAALDRFVEYGGYNGRENLEGPEESA